MGRLTRSAASIHALNVTHFVKARANARTTCANCSRDAALRKPTAESVGCCARAAKAYARSADSAEREWWPDVDVGTRKKWCGRTRTRLRCHYCRFADSSNFAKWDPARGSVTVQDKYASGSGKLTANWGGGPGAGAWQQKTCRSENATLRPRDKRRRGNIIHSYRDKFTMRV